MRQAGHQRTFIGRAWRGVVGAAVATLLGLGVARAAVPGQPIAQPDLALQAMRFEEPLVPTATTSADEDAALLAAITAYRAAPARDDYAALEAFVATHPDSGWRLAVLTDLGLAYYRTGYFSKAIEAFEAAWQAGQGATERHARALADRAGGELLKMHARLGHAERLDTLLTAMDGRGLTGRASEWRDGAKEGLWTMRNRPGIAYLCGPMALKNLLLAGGATPAKVAFLDAYESGPHGVSLAEVGDLATKANLPHRLIHRAPGDPIPMPAVVHWKVNHFAAIVGERDGIYELADPTFGGARMWVTRKALDTESDGYFLVAGDQPATVWQDVPADEARRIYGMGDTGQNDPSATNPQDQNCDCGGASAGGGDGDDDEEFADDGDGMTVYHFKEMLSSLNLVDTPVGYKPPVGPSVKVMLSYNQRDASQPANFSFYNVSQKWTTNWLAYVQDDPTNLGTNAELVEAGGGYTTYTGYSTGTRAFTPDVNNGSVTTITSTSPITYTRTFPDGSAQVYSASNGATAFPRYVFLTKKIDPRGNAVTLSYDSSMRLTTITDATGRNTTFTYGLSGSPLLITKITDPFGRSASLAYDSSGRLSSVTDVLGLVSSYGYDGSSLVDRLTTPYGTTTFVYGDNGNSRYLQATDPLGQTERTEYIQGLSQIPFSDPANTVPVGIVAPFNEYLNYRDTFYWDKHAYAVAHGDYTKARNRHWVHLASNTNYTGNTIESIKNPLENRVWFNYPGQPNGGLGTAQTGTLNKPSAIGRVLDDGTTQITYIAYNAAGNPVSYTDPVGRVTTLQYAPNGIDVTAVLQKTATGSVTMASFTYSAQHLPLTATDAAGKTTTNTYNAAGQILTSTDALGHVTTYTYNALGYLLAIVNANGKTQASFTYDSFGRVATSTDSEGWTVANTYDAMDRLTKQTFPDGTARTWTYNNLDLVSSKDRQSRTTSFTYDAVRNLTAITDPVGQITKLGYYENSLPKTLTDANGRVTSWAIDLENRLTAKSFPDGRTVANTYEATTRRLHAITDPLGQTKQFSYMVDDNLLGYQYLNAVNPTPAVSFTYDPYFPRVVSMTDGAGTTTYSYNPAGVVGAEKLASETPPFANSTITYTYDALGRPTGRTVGGSSETVAYDALGRVSQHGGPLGTFLRTYLGQTNQLTGSVSALLGTRRTYDTNTNDRRLTTILNSPVATRYGYTTTAENDISAIAESLNQVTWTYGYDADERTKTASASSGATYAYTYDPAGNVTSIARPAGTTAVTVNADNQIATAGGKTYRYDANGNLLSDGTRTYTWDAENRLIGIGYPATPGASSTFRYDGLGRRIAIGTTSGGIYGETHYGWCGPSLCQARTSADVPARRYLAEGEADFANGTSLFYGVDQLGSVRDVIAAPSGLKVAHFDYEPYGNPTTAQGSRTSWTDFRYAGLFYHQQSGLYLATYRAYDPVVGRWLSRDPMGEAGGFNLYGYVAGKTLQLADPLGLEDLILEPKTDPAYKYDDTYNNSSYFTVGSHGSPDDSDHILAPDGTLTLTVDATATAIINAGYKGSKPVQLIVCFPGKGGANSFAQKLANALAQKLGKPVSVVASPNSVTVGYNIFDYFFGGHSNPGPGGWLTFSGSPPPSK